MLFHSHCCRCHNDMVINMSNNVCYDAFISYRRDNGFYLARLVRDQLEARGISAFLDLEELRSGEFNQKLYEAIRNSKNFILILPKGALNRCVHEDDWVRKEIFYAIDAGSNIIPVLGEDFEWPRELYDKMPDEIKSLESFSGVKTSKDYLSAMIDRLISFMHGVKQSVNENDKNHQIESRFVSTEKYFSDGIKDSATVELVDMAFHAGAEWFTDIEKNDLLYDLIGKGVHIRVLLNNPETSELLARNMRHPRKKYMGFKASIQNWIDLQNEHSDLIEIRIVDIPLLRRYYSFHMKDSHMDTVNVKHYTYANPRPERNFQSIIYSDSTYFMMYRKEYEYLWERAVSYEKIDNKLESSKNEHMDTVGFFEMATHKLCDVSEIDMCFRAGSEWHLNANVVNLLSKILEKGIRLRVIVNQQSVVEATACHMRQPLKKYYGYDKTLADWVELEKQYPEKISVHVADVPLMRRFYHIKGQGIGLAKVSYYTYGNYITDKDYQMIMDSTDQCYELYAEEFEYLWNNASHDVK